MTLDSNITEDMNTEPHDIDNDGSFHSLDTSLPSASTPFADSQTKRKIGKRKASPLFKLAAKKTTPTRKSLPSKKSQLSSESFLAAVKDPDFANSFAPLLQTVIAPTIQTAIEKAVDSAIEMLRSSILNDIVSSNVQLKKTIDEQIEISEQQNKIIKEQADKLDEKTKMIDELEQKCDNLSVELNKVKAAVNDLEQYGRQNSLRFSKLGFDPKLPENELIKKTTAFINDRMLPNDPLLSESDIDRCHPIGQLSVTNQA